MYISNLILAATATATALVAGLFYAYSCSVSPGLGRLPDAGYLSAMQSINRAIQNPVFFVSFLGCLILLPLSTYLHYNSPVTLRFWLLLAATIVYVIGVFGVTVVGNVPMNEALDKFDIQHATQETLASQRALFERRWNMLNNVRTIASLVSVVLVIVACIGRGKAGEGV